MRTISIERICVNGWRPNSNELSTQAILKDRRIKCKKLDYYSHKALKYFYINN